MWILPEKLYIYQQKVQKKKKKTQSLTFYDSSYSETWTGPAGQGKETKTVFFSGARKQCPSEYDI